MARILRAIIGELATVNLHPGEGDDRRGVGNGEEGLEPGQNHRHRLLVGRLEFLAGDSFEVELLRVDSIRQCEQRGDHEKWKRFHRTPQSRWMPRTSAAQ